MKSAIYEAKKAVVSAITDVDAWSDMAGRVYAGMDFDEVEGPQFVSVLASGMQPQIHGVNSRGWIGDIDILVCGQSDEVTPDQHAEWCARIEALLFADDLDERISNDNISCQVPVPGAAMDVQMDGRRCTRYTINGKWTIKEDA